MKKRLNLITAISVIGGSPLTIIACGSTDTTNNKATKIPEWPNIPVLPISPKWPKFRSWLSKRFWRMMKNASKW